MFKTFYSEDFKLFDVATFAGPPPFNQTLWPDHCIEDSEGAKLHENLTVTDVSINDLLFTNIFNNIFLSSLSLNLIFPLIIFYYIHWQIVHDAVFIKKGTNPEIDSYSAFIDNLHTSDGRVTSGDTGLASKLKENGIGTVFVVGLATDYCVGNTALDALGLGLGAVVVEDGASAGVAADSVDNMKEKLVSKGAIIVNDLSLLTSRSEASSATNSQWLISLIVLILLKLQRHSTM